MIRLAAAIYVAAGLALTWLCWQSLMWAVWGARVHWMLYVGLISALVLAGGAGTLLATAEKGQRACAAGVAGLALLMVPAAAETVPSEGLRVSPWAWAAIAGYVVLAAGVLHYPERLRWARTLTAGLVLAIAATAGTKAFRFWQDGEFNRPVIVVFRAERSGAPLELPERLDAILPPQVLPAQLRTEAGRLQVGGRMGWTGMVGPRSRTVRLVVIATGPIPEARPLPFPRSGTVVHVWNGERWTAIPENAPCYPAGVVLQTDGMISRTTATGGRQLQRLFVW